MRRNWGKHALAAVLVLGIIYSASATPPSAAGLDADFEMTVRCVAPP